MGENISLADIVGSQYLLEILQTSLAVENSENVVERCDDGCDGMDQFLIEMKEGYKSFCRKSTYILLKNVVKSGCFYKLLPWRAQTIFVIK